jgi:hypothetical protein
MEVEVIVGLLLILFGGITNFFLFFIFDYIGDILVSKGKIKKNTVGNIYRMNRYIFKAPFFLRKLNEVINETEDIQKREKYLKLRKKTTGLLIFELMALIIFVLYVICQCLL